MLAARVEPKNAPQESEKTDNLKPLVFRQFQAGVDKATFASLRLERMIFVTLILTVNGPETIWLLADRRVSYVDRPPKDDARKVMFLETNDGVAIPGYTGLGDTGVTEPSDWMSAVLRGRNVPLEQSIAILAEAGKAQLPPHLSPRIPQHHVLIPAFLNDKVKLYTIGIAGSPAPQFRWGHLEVDNSRTPRLGLAGSGAFYLTRRNKETWKLILLNVVKAYERGRLSELAVADHLAKLNNKVHLADKKVGPHCLVAWQHRKGGVRNGGGGHQCY
jgi:hypothetical protein